MAQDSKNGEAEITALLAPYQAFVTYTPLRTEIPFLDYCALPLTDMIYHISPRASLDPKDEARKAMGRIGAAPAAVLIPGRSFDATGTRHGQGGGWYDRFLAEVPESWLRVGFCYRRQFSETPLVRQPWDQAMDAVCVVDGDTLSLYHGKRV